MHPDIERVLISEEEVDAIISRIASEIDRDYAGSDHRLLLLCILKGSVVFMGELMKKLTVPVEIDFMKVSSYGAGTVTTGSVNIHLDLLRPDLDKCDILLIEDIVDSGNTLSYLKRLLMQRKPASVKICTLLDKPERRKVELEPDYSCFIIPDEFVVGYGLDYDEKFRNIPEVCILKRSVYEK